MSGAGLEGTAIRKSSFQENILCPQERGTQLPGFPEHKRAFCQLHYINFRDSIALQG